MRALAAITATIVAVTLALVMFALAVASMPADVLGSLAGLGVAVVAVVVLLGVVTFVGNRRW